MNTFKKGNAVARNGATMGAVTIIQSDPHANEAYGALREGVHIAGYTFERACGKLELLLEHGRWRDVGDGFDDVNAFLASIKLDSLRPLAEQRKRIAQRIKELQPKASNRQIAKVLGVGRSIATLPQMGQPQTGRPARSMRAKRRVAQMGQPSSPGPPQPRSSSGGRTTRPKRKPAAPSASERSASGSGHSQMRSSV